MYKALDRHIRSKNLFDKRDQLLVALSGGVDSVVLIHLLTALEYKVVLAHCNFKLRGKDSEADEAFCLALAKRLNLPIHLKAFDTKAYANINKQSIQMAARELRYQWFDELLQENAYDYLLTAHHANDSVESIVLNFIRGTGISGLLGIDEKRNNLVRPLLAFKKAEIIEFAKAQKIKFRKDASNEEDKYKRNFVRLKLLPLIKTLNPAFDDVLLKNADLLADEKALANAFVEQKKKELLQLKNGNYFISIQQLLRETHYQAILGAVMYAFGFNRSQIEDMLKHLLQKGLSGKTFKNKKYQVNLFFDQIEIAALTGQKFKALVFNDLKALENSGLFKISKIGKVMKVDGNALLLDASQLVFPLHLRTKKTGDKFKPFGMDSFKLLSDFYKEQKLSPTEKQNTKILVNAASQIMWIVGHRSDERFRIPKQLKNILLIEYLGH